MDIPSQPSEEVIEMWLYALVGGGVFALIVLGALYMARRNADRSSGSSPNQFGL
ncbi:MAG: hypothetical protein V1856_00295 [Candidatus Liptonbacteria bacterium]